MKEGINWVEVRQMASYENPSQFKNIDWLVSFGTLDQIEILCIYCVYRSWVIGRVKEVSNPPTHTG